MDTRRDNGKYLFAVVLILLGIAWVGGIVVLLHAIGAGVPAVKAQAVTASATATASPSPTATATAKPSPSPSGKGSSKATATPSPTPVPPITGLPTKHYSLTLQTFPMTPDAAWLAEHHYQFDTAIVPPLDAHPDWVRYGPTTNLVLPAHALITMTIQNYDGATPILNGFYAQVQGTLNDTMTVDGKTMSSVDPGNISHTFTIHSIPSSSQPYLYVSVPIYAEPDNVESAGADNGLPPQPEDIQFSFVTGGPGNYIWQCFDPCGYGFDGFGGPMQTRGYMLGTIVVKG